VRVLLTGANGMLGRDVMARLGARHHVLPYPREALDVTDPASVRAAFAAARPEAVIHCAAYTDVDGAESAPEEALRVNALGARHVAVAAQEAGAALAYVSTDYVFDGAGPGPYTEFDPTAPLNAYGRSKLAGELEVRAHARRHFIVRSAWLYGAHGRNFVHTILRLARERDRLEVVDDQVGCPTWTRDLADVLGTLLGGGAYGTYHAASEGSCSWHAFACAVLEARGLTTPVEAVTSDRFPRPARRPAVSVLRNLALEAQGVRMRPWRDALAEYLAGAPAEPGVA